MSEKDLSSVNHALERKELSLDEEGNFNEATNSYISKLAEIDPVLAGIMKNQILYAFGSNDYQTFEGTEQELNSYIGKPLPKEPKRTGFCIERPVSQRLANWLNIDTSSMLTGPKLTKLVWEELKRRNLVYQEDKRVFRVDQETAELFGLNMVVVNSSTDHRDTNGFNFCNLQRYIVSANTI
jgi:hypothetical protein